MQRREEQGKEATAAVKSRGEQVEVQSCSPGGDMSAGAKKSSKPESRDSGVAHRLTFRADPDLLEPREKQRKKLTRNEIEKFRRDRLNAYFMELAKIVPLVMQSNKTIDKASILRLTVAYLRIYHDLVKGSRHSKLSCNWRPDLTMYKNLGNLLLESFGGFLLVVNRKGIVIFAAESITKYLGHNLSDVLGSEVKNIIHPDDFGILMKQFEATANDAQIKDTDDDTDVVHVPVNGQRSFCLKMLNVLNPQSRCYEIVHLVGHLKRIPPANGSCFATNGSGAQTTPEPSVCLVVVARLVSRQSVQDLLPHGIPTQWITRHELDGKITYSDQRGALLTGFLPGESIGFSPYSLLHPDDVASVVTVHNMFLSTGCVPQTVFRMFTKSREILYVQTNTHLVVDMWTSKPKFIISINTVLEEPDGIVALEEQHIHIQRAADSRSSSETVAENEGFSERQTSCLQNGFRSGPKQSFISENIQLESALSPSPEVETEGSSVVVVVGESRYMIDLSETRALDADKAVHNSGIGVAFDSYATEDDGGKSIPTVKPSFINGSAVHLTAAPRNPSPESVDSCPKAARSSVRHRRDDESDLPAGHVNGKVSPSADVLRRRVSDGGSSSLIELSELTKLGYAAMGLGCRVQGNALLRQLLTEKLGTSCNGCEAHADANDSGMSFANTAPFVGFAKGNDRPSSGNYNQMKLMLESELISAVGTLQDPSDGSQKVHNTDLTFPQQIDSKTLHVSDRSLPCNISQSLYLNGHVHGARTESGAHPKSANEHGAILPANPHHVTTASKTHPPNPSTSGFGVEFTASADDDEKKVPNHSRIKCNGTLLDSCQVHSSQNGQSIPPSWISAAAVKGQRIMRMFGDPLCSSVVGLVSRMPHDDRYNGFKRQLSEQQNGRTCSAGTPGCDSGVVGSQHPTLDSTATSESEFSEASLPAVQAASTRSTVGEWHEDFNVVVGEGSRNARSSIESNTWPSAFTDSDDAPTIAQQDSDEFSSWKWLTDNL